jgi:MFS family permease
MGIKISFVLLLGLNLGFLFMNIPPVIEKLMALYGVTYSSISVLISALLWTHAGLQVPGGMIVDRIGTRSTLIISLLSILIGNALAAISPSLGLAIVGRVLAGVGTGLGFIATMKMITLFSPPNKSGAYQAQFGSAFAIGSVVAYISLPHIIEWGWRWTYIVPGIACIPLLGVLFMIGLEEQASSSSPPLSLRHVVSIPSGWVLGGYHALSYGSVLTLGNWVPSLLAEVGQGNSATQLAWGGALVMLISGVGRICGGFMLLRIPSLWMANGSILVLSFLLLILSLLPTPGTVLILAFLCAWFASINFGAFWQIAAHTTNSRSLGTLFGFINLLANLGAIGFTLLFGWVKDEMGTFAWGFGVLAIVAILTLLAGWPVLRSGASRAIKTEGKGSIAP